MSRGTDDLWVLFDDDMRARARIAYPSGLIPGVDQEILQVQMRQNGQPAQTGCRNGNRTDRATGGTADPAGAPRMETNDAYLVHHDPKVLEAVAKALAEVHASPGGLTTLLDRLSEGVVLDGGRIQLADWGNITWNELLKKREVIRCLQRAKDGSAVGDLGALLQAECSHGQWADIIQPAIARALSDIGTKEAVQALKDALSSPISRSAALAPSKRRSPNRTMTHHPQPTSRRISAREQVLRGSGAWAFNSRIRVEVLQLEGQQRAVAGLAAT